MRIRSIKPEFWRSRDIAALTLEDRLLFIGLWSYVDDNGVGRDEPALIVADLFAHDLSVSPHDTLMRVHGGLERLHTAGLIRRYEADGRPFFEIVTWDAHQKINRPSASRYPRSDAKNVRLTEPSVSPHNTLNAGTGEQGIREQGAEEQGKCDPADAGSSSDAASDADPDAPSTDVIDLCDYLAGKVRENGHKVGAVGKRWHDAMDRLIRIDGYTPEQIAQVIDWATADEFWCTNIQSASKLREKFDTLKAQMFRARNNTNRYMTASERNLQRGAQIAAQMAQREAEQSNPFELEGGVA